MGSIYDIMDAFRSVRPLIDIPDAWRMCFEETPEASCWYPAHINCQVRESAIGAALVNGLALATMPCPLQDSQLGALYLLL